MTAEVDLSHTWVGAAHIPLNTKQARWASHRGSIRITEPVKVEILESYCVACRKKFDDVHDTDCSAQVNNEHLRGGPIGERRKRKHPHHDCDQYECYEPLPTGWTRAGSQAAAR